MHSGYGLFLVNIDEWLIPGIMPIGDHKANVNLDPLPEPIVFERPGGSSNKGGNNNNNKITPPTSLETDPDPSKTVYCTSPYKAGARLVQYALMIDAGSTGSRIHIYKFNNCGASPEYEYEIFKQKKPGLSSFKDDPTAAAESLDELLDEAVKSVPKELQACTPVAVKATAGLRLLGARQSKAILSAVRKRLQDRYPFPLYEGTDGGAVVIMDGKEEGVYAWITANYLLHTIRADTPKGAPAYAVLDLGGASTQIVFEPTFEEDDDSKLAEGEHKYDLRFGGRTHVLYQHSYLGYGLMRARKSVHALVDFMATLRPSYKFNASEDEEGGKGKDKIGNPCLARGTERLIKIEDELTGAEREVIMAGEQVGSFEACNRVVELVMAKDACVFLLLSFPLLFIYFSLTLTAYAKSNHAHSTVSTNPRF
jgi:guanosine-diphosphatase